MIRKLSRNDHQAVMALVGPKPAENLFIIGDIEAFGYDSDIQEIWGQFEDDQLIAVMLRYDQNYIPYSESTYDVQGFANIINQNANRVEISGLKHLIEPLQALIHKPVRKHSETYYAKCTELSYKIDEDRFQHTYYLQPADYQENIDMLLSIPEFSTSNLSVEARERAENLKLVEHILYEIQRVLWYPLPQLQQKIHNLR